MFIESRRVLPWLSISLLDEVCARLVAGVGTFSWALSPSFSFDEILLSRAATVIDSSAMRFALGDNAVSSSLRRSARRLLRLRCVEPARRQLMEFVLSPRHSVPILGPGFNILAGYSQSCNDCSQTAQQGNSRPLWHVVNTDAGMFLGL